MKQTFGCFVSITCCLAIVSQVCAVNLEGAPVPDGNITYVKERRLGDSVTFTMRTKPSSKNTFSWEINGLIRTTGVKSDSYQSSLTIESIQIEDFGNYTLVMTSTEGVMAYATFQLRLVASTVPTTIDRVREGLDYRHLCHVPDSPGSEVWWIKNETGSEFRSFGRLLFLSNINRTDAGDYLCQIGNANKHQSNVTYNITLESLYVDVQYPVTITFEEGPSPVAKGGNFSMTCAITGGNPRPHLSISYGDDSSIIDGDTSLNLVLPALCNNTGVYMCFASNSMYFHFVTKTINIGLPCRKRAPLPDGHITYVQEKRLHQSVTFVMRTQAFPKASYTWLHNNVTITEGVTDSFYNTTLRIKSIELSNYGNFSLIIENSEGRYVAHYELRPTGRPEAPVYVNFFHLTDFTVGLVWFTGFDYGLTANYSIVRWHGSSYFTMGYEIMDTNNASSYLGPHHLTCNMTDLSPDTVYELSVVAHSEAGHSDPSNTIKFRTKQYVDKPFPTTSIDDYKFNYKVLLYIFGGGIGLVLIAFVLIYIRRKLKR